VPYLAGGGNGGGGPVPGVAFAMLKKGKQGRTETRTLVVPTETGLAQGFAAGEALRRAEKEVIKGVVLQYARDNDAREAAQEEAERLFRLQQKWAAASGGAGGGAGGGGGGGGYGGSGGHRGGKGFAGSFAAGVPGTVGYAQAQMMAALQGQASSNYAASGHAPKVSLASPQSLQMGGGPAPGGKGKGHAQAAPRPSPANQRSADDAADDDDGQGGDQSGDRGGRGDYSRGMGGYGGGRGGSGRGGPGRGGGSGRGLW
jgi:hypothetical protein